MTTTLEGSPSALPALSFGLAGCFSFPSSRGPPPPRGRPEPTTTCCRAAARRPPPAFPTAVLSPTAPAGLRGRGVEHLRRGAVLIRARLRGVRSRGRASRSPPPTCKGTTMTSTTSRSPRTTPASFGSGRPSRAPRGGIAQALDRSPVRPRSLGPTHRSGRRLGLLGLGAAALLAASGRDAAAASADRRRAPGRHCFRSSLLYLIAAFGLFLIVTQGRSRRWQVALAALLPLAALAAVIDAIATGWPVAGREVAFFRAATAASRSAPSSASPSPASAGRRTAGQ